MKHLAESCSQMIKLFLMLSKLARNFARIFRRSKNPRGIPRAFFNALKTRAEFREHFSTLKEPARNSASIFRRFQNSRGIPRAFFNALKTRAEFREFPKRCSWRQDAAAPSKTSRLPHGEGRHPAAPQSLQLLPPAQRWALTLRFVCFFVLLLASLCQAAPLAMLTGVRGPVSIVRSGKTLPAKTGVPLQAGDVVRAGAGGGATIYFVSRPPQTLGARQQVTINAGGKASAPSLWASVYQGVASGFARRGEKIGATVRPGFASDQVAPLSPVNSRVAGLPTLFWALDNAPAHGDFLVQLVDTAGNELWRIATPQTHLQVPPVPMAAGAKYFWTVTPRERNAAGKLTPLEEKHSSPVWFEMAPAAEAEAVRRDLNQLAIALTKAPETTRRAAQAALLSERGLLAGAIAALTRRTLETEAARSASAALRRHDAVVTALDAAARWQLRRLYLDTRQTELAVRIAPDSSAPVTETVLVRDGAAPVVPPPTTNQPTNQPTTPPTNAKLGVDLSPVAGLPAPVREAMADSEALIRIQDEILNPPAMGVDDKGQPLTPAASRAAFEALNTRMAAMPEHSLERWRAARELATLAARIGWDAYDKKNPDEASQWFARQAELKKTSYDAARGYYEAQFSATQKQIAELEARTPIDGLFSDDRLLLSTLHHVQGMRGGALENLARVADDTAGILKWAEAQLAIFRRAHEYKVADLKKGGSTPEFVQQDTILFSNALDSIADALNDLGRFDEAEKKYLETLELRRSLPSTYVQRYVDIPLRRLGGFYKMMGDNRRARDYYEQAWQDVEASMPARRARWEKTDNPAYRDLMEVETAQTRVVILNNLSLVVGALGDYKASEQYLRQAIAELDALPNSPRAKTVGDWQRAVTLGNLAVLHADTGRHDDSLVEFDQAVTLWRAQGYGEQAGFSLLNAAGMYHELGRVEEARSRLAQARQFFQTARDVPGLIAANLLSAIDARDHDQLDEAALRAAEALALARQSGNFGWISAGARNLAAVRFKQNRLDEADTLLAEATRHDERTGAPLDLARTLFWQGQVLEKRNQPAQALEKYRRAIPLIEGVRATAQSETTFGESKHIYSVYESIVSLLIKMNRATEAFDYLGRAKSKQLQDALRLTNLKSGDVTVQARLDRAAGLQSKIRAFEATLEAERGKPDAQRSAEKIAALQTRLEAARNELKSVAAPVEATKPQLLGESAAPALADVQKQIPANAVLVQWAPLGEQLYVFVVTRDAIKVQLLPTAASEVWTRIREFRTLMDTARRRAAAGQNIAVTDWLSADPNVAPLRENLLALRTMLLAPVEAQFADKDTVVFVPNRLLYYLPLHALARRDGNRLSFLGQEKNVASLAAADVLSVLQKQPARGQSLLALGNPEGAALPGAGEEARALGRLFANAQVLTGVQATKNAVLTPQNEGRGIWHLATHGVLNASQPGQSYILLAPGARPGDEELTIGEVYGLDLKNTDLVTLSACQTAIGERNPDGLEITSLATSFARAGARSVVASLWSVADDSTREFMVEFYARLAAGEGKAEALRHAQARLMSTPRFNNPYYWAPFVLMGDWR